MGHSQDTHDRTSPDPKKRFRNCDWRYKKNGAGYLKSSLKISYAAWIDDANSAVHIGVNISPTKDCIFLPSHLSHGRFCRIFVNLFFFLDFMFIFHILLHLEDLIVQFLSIWSTSTQCYKNAPVFNFCAPIYYSICS